VPPALDAHCGAEAASSRAELGATRPAVAVPTDQVLILEAGLQSTDSCASIWWLDAGTKNYQLVLSPDTFSCNATSARTPAPSP
jgi:hypothetical protein